MRIPFRAGESVARSLDGHELAELGGMRIVAGDTVVAFAWPTREIPVAAHPAVGAVIVVALLRTMALRAELYGSGQR